MQRIKGKVFPYKLARVPTMSSPDFFAHTARSSVPTINPVDVVRVVQQGYVQNLVNVSMLTLVSYNACCVA